MQFYSNSIEVTYVQLLRTPVVTDKTVIVLCGAKRVSYRYPRQSFGVADKKNTVRVSAHRAALLSAFESLDKLFTVHTFHTGPLVVQLKNSKTFARILIVITVVRAGWRGGNISKIFHKYRILLRIQRKTKNKEKLLFGFKE